MYTRWVCGWPVWGCSIFPVRRSSDILIWNDVAAKHSFILNDIIEGDSWWSCCRLERTSSCVCLILLLMFVLRLSYVSCVFVVVVSFIKYSEHFQSFTSDGIKSVTELTIPNTLLRTAVLLVVFGKSGFTPHWS